MISRRSLAAVMVAFFVLSAVLWGLHFLMVSLEAAMKS